MTQQPTIGYSQPQTIDQVALFGSGLGFSKHAGTKCRRNAAVKTKGKIEAEISQAIIQFEIDYMGRGPKETRAHIVEDLVVVRLKGVLTPAEEQLTKSADGKDLVKKMRATLIDRARPLLYQVVGDITGAKIIDLHTDISTESGERVFVFSLDHNLQKSLARDKIS